MIIDVLCRTSGERESRRGITVRIFLIGTDGQGKLDISTGSGGCRMTFWTLKSINLNSPAWNNIDLHCSIFS